MSPGRLEREAFRLAAYVTPCAAIAVTFDQPSTTSTILTAIAAAAIVVALIAQHRRLARASRAPVEGTIGPNGGVHYDVERDGTVVPFRTADWRDDA